MTETTTRTFTVLLREITTTAYYVEADTKDEAFEAYTVAAASRQEGSPVPADRQDARSAASARASWRFRCSECGHGRNLYGWTQAVAYGPVAPDGLLAEHEDVEDCFIFEGSIECRVHPSARIETKVDGRFCVWKVCEGRCKGEPEKLRDRGYFGLCPDCNSTGGSWVLPEREAVVA